MKQRITTVPCTRHIQQRKYSQFHALLKSARLLPEQSLPRWKVRSLEERVLQDSLHAPQRLNHVGPVRVEIPQLPVVTLMRPPERVHPQHRLLLEHGLHTPSPVVGKRVPILAEERVDSWHAPIPQVLQILQCELLVLRVGLLLLERVLGPDPLRVDKLTLPGLQVTEEVACDHVDGLICDATTTTSSTSETARIVVLVSFSFVNTDLRDRVRERYNNEDNESQKRTRLYWILLNTNVAESNRRIMSWEGHFYETKNEQTTDATTTATHVDIVNYY